MPIAKGMREKIVNGKEEKAVGGEERVKGKQRVMSAKETQRAVFPLKKLDVKVKIGEAWKRECRPVTRERRRIEKEGEKPN